MLCGKDLAAWSCGKDLQHITCREDERTYEFRAKRPCSEVNVQGAGGKAFCSIQGVAGGRLAAGTDATASEAVRWLSPFSLAFLCEAVSVGAFAALLIADTLGVALFLSLPFSSAGERLCVLVASASIV